MGRFIRYLTKSIDLQNTLARTHSISKWIKISALEITIFGLKKMVKSGLDFFYLEIKSAPSELLLPNAKNLPESLNWPDQLAVTMKGLVR